MDQTGGENQQPQRDAGAKPLERASAVGFEGELALAGPHPVVGGLTVSYETMQLTAEGLIMAVFTAEAGSASQRALDILASWSATPDQADTAVVANKPNSG